MLAEPKYKLFHELISGSEKEELIWMNGYISGLIKGNMQASTDPETLSTPKKITIVYGTETGNAKKLATELAAKAKQKTIPVKLAALDQYRITDLTREEHLFVVISTQGDGEPPVAAKNFYDHIHHNGFRLDQLKYSVLALGDSSYPLFCKTGEDVDMQLHKLGATRVVPIRKCDVDFEADAAAWFSDVLNIVAQQPLLPAVAAKQLQEIKTNARKIYRGTVLSNTLLNDKESDISIHHIELATGEVDYQPGDSIGIVPENRKEAVFAILLQLGLQEDTIMVYKGAEHNLLQLLTSKLTIHHLHERVIKKYATITGLDIPDEKMDLINLLKTYPVKDRQQFEELLHELPVQSPRIYTIASSPAAHSGEIHLTVEQHHFNINGIKHTGIGSSYLTQLRESETVDFFVQKNKRFKLPASDQNVLMIAPGTGIASFRSFISERDMLGATGKNWLFFGSGSFVTDFLYQTEIQNWMQTGVLHQLTLSFSQDQPGIYIWHKLLEKGREVFDWIASGAHVYVSGEKAPMSREVEKVLLQVIETWGGYSANETIAYFEKMKEEGRYSKEVY